MKPAELYEHLAPYVRRLVRRFVGSDGRQHDIVQDVFYRILASRPEGRSPTQLRAWVRAITLNVIFSEFRRVRTHPTTPLEEGDLVADLERTAEMRDLLSRLGTMLERLPEAERSAFVLRVIERRSVKEIAKIQGHSPATVQRRLRRPRRILRTFLAQNPAMARAVAANAQRRAASRPARRH